METSKYVEQVKTELTAVVQMITEQFGPDYDKKNPDMVRHLMDKIQEQKYIELRADGK